MTHEYSINKISATDTYSVRWPVLRPNKPVDSCHFDGDELETTRHLGIYLGKQLCGVVSVFSQNSPLLKMTNQLQVRGMAVLPEYRGCGFGAALIHHVELTADAEKDEVIWFNARANAVGFYKKMEYEIIGVPFQIADIGTHYVMYKRL